MVGWVLRRPRARDGRHRAGRADVGADVGRGAVDAHGGLLPDPVVGGPNGRGPGSALCCSSGRGGAKNPDTGATGYGGGSWPAAAGAGSPRGARGAGEPAGGAGPGAGPGGGGGTPGAL